MREVPLKNKPCDRGIKCPKCGATRLRILRTRRGDNQAVRRRQCRGCMERVTTYERAIINITQT